MCLKAMWCHGRFRNFEQLHRRLKDMPNYTLSLPRKRFFTSSLDNNFVLERCVLLDKYLRDLLAIPSIAELHEVWDFLSMNSQHYAFGVAPSMMKTLAGESFLISSVSNYQFFICVSSSCSSTVFEMGL
jgi:hypothetical protein